jgi:tetratricopeptide (TPR) repeat protein
MARAEALAAKNDAETLFLEFGAVKPDDYQEADRGRVARALAKAAEAARHDPMIAVGLSEKAAQLDRSPATLTLLALIEMDLGQRAAAAGHLDDALKLKADHVPALMARADLAMMENDFAVAEQDYQRALAAGNKAAKASLAKAHEAAAAKSKAVEDLKKTEAEIKVRVADAARNATRDWVKQITQDDEDNAERRRLAPEGQRRQEMANFVFTYSAGSRKAGDMFAFEGKVEKILEKTYDFVSDKLGYKRPGRTPVVLMTREEFAEKHAGRPEARAAGYWNGKEIVVNGGSTIDERFAQVMVHEFTHAVVTDLAGHGNAPTWMNEGLAENMRLCAMGTNGKLDERARFILLSLKKGEGLPSLGQLDPLFHSMADGVEVAYALSAQAVHLLIDKRGYGEYLDALREMKNHRPGQVIERHFGPLPEIDKEAQEGL